MCVSYNEKQMVNHTEKKMTKMNTQLVQFSEFEFKLDFSGGHCLGQKRETKI